MNKKILAALTAFLLTAGCLTACGGGDKNSQSANDSASSTTGSESASKTDESSNTDESQSTAPADDGLKAPVNDGKIDVSKGVTENMLIRSVYREGDTSRLAEKLKAADALANNKELKGPEKAELMTKIAFLGDSITAGSQATGDNQYTKVLQTWWEDRFSFYASWTNAGIGATDSYLAVHRVDNDVLADQPDIIFIEFINDQDSEFYKTTMDSLVRKCLSLPNKPAVVLIEMTMEDGTCPQNVHTQIAEAYDLPVISYHDAVLPEIQAGNIEWSEISPDNIHPNDIGHRMLGDMLIHFLTGVAETMDSAPEPTEFKETTPSPTGDKYHDAALADNSSPAVYITENDGFDMESSPWNFQNGWRTITGGTITFEIECKNLGMLYYKTTNGESGTATITVDGTELTSLNADFTGGWGDYATNTELFATDERKIHTVTVSVPLGQKFEILRWMIS